MPQLLAPLNLMFWAASLCQDNSSESSPIMGDEVGEHMARDLRPFLHAVSLQCLDTEVNACRLSFSSSHRFSMGFRSGDCDGHGKNLSSAVGEPFLCRFWGVVRIIVLLEGPATAHFKLPGWGCYVFISYLLVFDGVNVNMYPNKMSRAFGRKTAPQHQRSATILHGAFLYGYFSVYAKPTFDVCFQKALFWSHLNI